MMIRITNYKVVPVTHCPILRRLQGLTTLAFESGDSEGNRMRKEYFNVMETSLAKPNVTSFLCSQRTKLSASKEQAPYRQHDTADSDMAVTQPCHGIHHWLLMNTECVCVPP